MHRTVRSLVGRLVALLAMVGALAIGAPGLASAGGPTSVLLASPYTDAAAALYVTDADYALLSDLLGGEGLPAASEGSVPASAAGAPYVTATWLIHDVSVWRIDRIFLSGDDVWIVTELTSGDGGMPAGAGTFPGEGGNVGAVWHRPADPAALTTLLADRGLTAGSARPAGGSNGAAGVAAAPAERATAVSGTAPAWPWGIGGLVVGLLIGAAFVRFVTGRRENPEPTEPARMLPVT